MGGQDICPEVLHIKYYLKGGNGLRLEVQHINYFLKGRNDLHQEDQHKKCCLEGRKGSSPSRPSCKTVKQKPPCGKYIASRIIHMYIYMMFIRELQKFNCNSI